MTNKSPKVIGGYFLEAVKSNGGCPRTLRTDMGTENGVKKRIQKAFHEVFAESTNLPCFLYGKSMHNQRIESWLSILSKHNAQYWMNSFQTLIEDNLFDGSFMDKSLV
nr:uncharacterized protein LOC111505790 [Leptinotarsa decemlineata]